MKKDVPCCSCSLVGSCHPPQNDFGMCSGSEKEGERRTDASGEKKRCGVAESREDLLLGVRRVERRPDAKRDQVFQIDCEQSQVGRNRKKNKKKLFGLQILRISPERNNHYFIRFLSESCG